jgi:flagellum-specific peptidoglycan hydrolase FlgJ
MAYNQKISALDRVIDIFKQVANPVIGTINDASYYYNGPQTQKFKTLADQQTKRDQLISQNRQAQSAGLIRNSPRNDQYVYKGIIETPTSTSNRVKTANVVASNTNKRLVPTAIPTQTPMSQNPTWEELKTFFAIKAKEGGYDRAAIIGQKALESDRGKSSFAKERYNYGGIGAYDKDPNQAFSFKNPQDYWNYYDLMIKKRFPEAYQARGNGQQYLEALKKGNYATDKDYVANIMDTPEYKEYAAIYNVIDKLNKELDKKRTVYAVGGKK